MKLETCCSWSTHAVGWCLCWTGPLMRLPMRRQKTEPFWCSLEEETPSQDSVWPFWASSRTTLQWPPHVKDISEATEGGHLHSKWHFVNSKKRNKLLHILPLFAKSHLYIIYIYIYKWLLCPLKNVLFYNYSTCEITLTLACGLPHRHSLLQSPPGLGSIKT